MSTQIIRGNARSLPLADNSVDLVVTSPPYYEQRSYTDGGEHYAGQIGDEPTAREYVDALIACTAEMARVVHPAGSIWVNLGDKYAAGSGRHGAPKSLLGLPWRYALRCMDDLGLTLRQEVVWSKPNGVPESVTDRARRSHETWFHLTHGPRYYAAVDRLRVPHQERTMPRGDEAPAPWPRSGKYGATSDRHNTGNPLGALPSSVQTVPTEPLRVPPELDVEHRAAFPTWWPRWIVTGWCPSRVCLTCGAGLAPVVSAPGTGHNNNKRAAQHVNDLSMTGADYYRHLADNPRRIVGEACACPGGPGPTRPGVVLDPNRPADAPPPPCPKCTRPVLFIGHDPADPDFLYCPECRLRWCDLDGSLGEDLHGEDLAGITRHNPNPAPAHLHVLDGDPRDGRRDDPPPLVPLALSPCASSVRARAPLASVCAR